MPAYRRARSLDTLLAEIDRAAPRRSKASDGWIGDTSHQARPSDHNPNRAGVVRAIDVTHDPAGGLDAHVLAGHVADLLGKHPALRSGAYVIYRSRIISTDRLAEGWRLYTGSNAHTKHVHISVGTTAYDALAPWGWPAKPPKPSRPAKIRAAIKAARAAKVQARRDGKPVQLARVKAALRELRKVKPQ